MTEIICETCGAASDKCLDCRSHDRWVNKSRVEPTGKKLDAGKPPISLLHRDFLEGTAAVMGFGEKKYGKFNWCQGIEHLRLLDAAMRHIVAIVDGEDVDPESGLPHRHHACASLNMYCGMTVLHPELDDRYKYKKQEEAKRLDVIAKLFAQTKPNE